MINKIYIKNFMAFENVEIVLNNLGLVSVLGNNLDTSDSNGSAKSAIAEAIFWAIYGSTIRESTSVLDIIRDGTSLCRVEVELYLLEYRINIIRTRSKESKSIDLFIDNVCRSATNNDKLTNWRIIKTIGIPKSVFRNAVLYGHKIPRISLVRDSERKDLILNVLGIDYNESKKLIEHTQNSLLPLYKSTKISLEDLKYEVKSLQQRIIDSRRLVEEFKRHMAAKKTGLLDKAETCLSVIDDHVLRIQDLRKLIETAKKRVDVLVAHRNDIRKIVHTKDLSLKKINKDIANIENGIESDYSAICPMCGTYLDGKGIDNLKKAHAQLKKLKISEYTEREHAESSLMVIEKNMKGRVDELLILEQAYTRNTSRLRIAEAERKVIMSQLEDKDFPEFDEFTSTVDLVNVCMKLQTTKRKLKVLAEQIEDFDILLKMYQKKNMPAYTVQLLLPEINDSIVSYIRYLSDGQIKAYLEIENNKLIIVAESETGAKKFQMLSDGEKGRIDISLFFALNQLLRRKYESFNFMFIDEALDVIDKKGSRRLIELLDIIASKIGTILLVSHRTDIIEMVPQKIIVTKQNGVSNVSWIQN